VLVWQVECKICTLRFPILPREKTEGKSTAALASGVALGRFECPHCHEFNHYLSDDLIPGEAKVLPPVQP
jgi:hypothetical protein